MSRTCPMCRDVQIFRPGVIERDDGSAVFGQVEFTSDEEDEAVSHVSESEDEVNELAQEYENALRDIRARQYYLMLGERIHSMNHRMEALLQTYRTQYAVLTELIREMDWVNQAFEGFDMNHPRSLD